MWVGCRQRYPSGKGREGKWREGKEEAYIKDVLSPVGLDAAEGLGSTNRFVCEPGLHGSLPGHARHGVDLVYSCLVEKEEGKKKKKKKEYGLVVMKRLQKNY